MAISSFVLAPLTRRVQKVLALSTSLADALDQPSAGPEHLLLGLIAEGGGVPGAVFQELNVDLEMARRALMELQDEIPSEAAGSTEDELSARYQRAHKLAREVAYKMGSRYIGTEHLLLGLLKMNDRVVLAVLEKLNLSPDGVREAVQKAIELKEGRLQGSYSSSTEIGLSPIIYQYNLEKLTGSQDLT